MRCCVAFRAADSAGAVKIRQSVPEGCLRRAEAVICVGNAALVAEQLPLALGDKDQDGVSLDAVLGFGTGHALRRQPAGRAGISAVAIVTQILIGQVMLNPARTALHGKGMMPSARAVASLVEIDKIFFVIFSRFVVHIPAVAADAGCGVAVLTGQSVQLQAVQIGVLHLRTGRDLKAENRLVVPLIRGNIGSDRIAVFVLFDPLPGLADGAADVAAVGADPGGNIRVPGIEDPAAGGVILAPAQHLPAVLAGMDLNTAAAEPVVPELRILGLLLVSVAVLFILTTAPVADPGDRKAALAALFGVVKGNGSLVVSVAGAAFGNGLVKDRRPVPEHLCPLIVGKDAILALHRPGFGNKAEFADRAGGIPNAVDVSGFICCLLDGDIGREGALDGTGQRSQAYHLIADNAPLSLNDPARTAAVPGKIEGEEQHTVSPPLRGRGCFPAARAFSGLGIAARTALCCIVVDIGVHEVVVVGIGVHDENAVFRAVREPVGHALLLMSFAVVVRLIPAVLNGCHFADLAGTGGHRMLPAVFVRDLLGRLLTHPARIGAVGAAIHQPADRAGGEASGTPAGSVIGAFDLRAAEPVAVAAARNLRLGAICAVADDLIPARAFLRCIPEDIRHIAPGVGFNLICHSEIRQSLPFERIREFGVPIGDAVTDGNRPRIDLRVQTALPAG